MEVTIRRSNAKTLGLVLSGLGMAALGGWLMTLGDPLELVVGLVNVVFFGLGAIVGVWMAVGPRSDLRIDDHGFDDRTTSASVGRVPWSEVTAIHSDDFGGYPFVRVEVRDPFRYVERVSWFSRGTVRKNITRFGTSVTLSSIGLRTSHPELLAALTDAHQRYLAGRRIQP